MAGGRPTKLDPSYNQITIDHFKAGKTIAQLAARFEVHRSTIYQWAEDNQEFSDTLRAGLEMCQAYWEQVHHAKTLGQDQKSLDIKKTSERGLEFILKTRFRNDYSEKQEVVHDIKPPVLKIDLNGDK